MVDQLNRAGAFTLLAIASLTIMVGCVVVPGLSSIAPALGVAGAESWLVTVPALGVVLFGPLAGGIIDKEGPRRALIAGLLFYGLLGAAGVLLHGALAVMLDRLLLGGATALVMAGGTGLISQFYRGDARLRMIACQGMAIELGGVIFLFIGGLLAALSWRWPFVLYLTAWLLLVMLWVLVPPAPAADEGDETTAGEAAPVLKPVYAAALLSMVCFFTAVVTIPQQLAQQGAGAAQTGYFLAFISLVAVGAAALMPAVVRRLGSQNTLLVAFLCYAVAHLGFAFSAGWAGFLAGGLLMGCGFGFSIPLVNHLTIENSTAATRGSCLARLSMAIFLGQFLSSFIALLPGSGRLLFLVAALLALAAGSGLRLLAGRWR